MRAYHLGIAKVAPALTCKGTLEQRGAGGCSKNPLVPGSSPGGPTRNENANLRVGIFLSIIRYAEKN
jgi:hypothetical protein